MTARDPLAPLRHLGAVLTPDLIQGTYAALTPLRAQPLAGMQAQYDLSYGPDERHRLDLYMPVEPAHTVIVYLHGGGFSAGDKGGADAPFFGNWGAWATRAGYAAAAMTYRLAPQATWPSGAEDLAQAVAFLAAGAGGALTHPRIILAGQSAGAIHIADYLAGRAGRVSDAVAGAVLMSGIYDFTRHERLFFEAAYFGEDLAKSEEHSTLQALTQQAVPLMFTVSEFDPPQFQRQAAHLVEAMITQTKRLPRLHVLAGHNHVSPALFIGAEGDRLGPMITDFVTRCLSPVPDHDGCAPGFAP
jgi:acetyl esterase/lipase